MPLFWSLLLTASSAPHGALCPAGLLSAPFLCRAVWHIRCFTISKASSKWRGTTVILEAVMAGSSFASETCEDVLKCGPETAGEKRNLIIQIKERNNKLQWRQWKTQACASKTYSLTLPLISLVGGWFVCAFLGLNSTDPRAFPVFLDPTVSAVTSLLLSSPWNWYHAELTAAITTVILLWELYSSSKVKKFQRQMFSLGRGK